MIKVSVVVPTYCSGPGLDRVMKSLTGQTMPHDQFEVIFVDDGSPDDTPDRLHRLSDAPPNVRVIEIEHSGWPSRPRNVGLENARGEYVLFMDHDDELYPSALAAGYALAARNNADVLNGKETRTDQPKWAIDVYTRNWNNAVNRTDVHPIVPTNPHKLFRRQFLLDHGIRFPEGRRVLWEDVFFTVEAYRHARVISVLTDTPFYHWVRQGETASSSYGKDVEEYWHWVHQIFVFITEQLGDDPRTEQFRQLILLQYRTRVLAVIGQNFFAQTDEQIATALSYIRRIITDHVPEEFDQHLPKTLRARAWLLRHDQISELRSLAGVDAGTVGISTASAVTRVGRKLRITSVSEWATDAGPGLSLIRHGRRILRDLPDDVLAAVPAELVDVTDELHTATTQLGVRSAATKVVWMLPTQHRIEVTGEGATTEVRVVATAELDITRAAAGRPLATGTWELNASNHLLGTLNHRALRSAAVGRVSVTARRREAVAYRTKGGMLSVDISAPRARWVVLRRVTQLIRSGQYRRLAHAIMRRLGRRTGSV